MFARWSSNVLPRLFSSGNRSDFKERNIPQVGDICILHLKKGKCGKFAYKYCKVIDIIPSRDKLTRTVKISYFNSPSKVKKVVIVDVGRLTLIQALKDQSDVIDNAGSSKGH